jgi:hypothetical protein
MRLTRKTAAVTAAAFFLSGGAAYASWTIASTGTATVTTAKIDPIQFQMLGNPLADKWPGEDSPIAMQYQNPNGRPVTGKQITASVTGTTSSDCPVKWFHVTPPSANADLQPSTWSYPYWWSASKVYSWADIDRASAPQVRLDEEAPDACQNVGVNITFGLA